MSTFYVFDLDGTLADCQHRVHLTRKPLRNYKKFFEACSDDAPIQPIIELLLRLWNTRAVTIEIWSGRSDEVRKQTETWLCQQGINPVLLTNMRKAGDYRPDDVIKQEFLDNAPVKPDIVFDDRDRVVNMWRANGIVCCQVAPGDF